MNDAILFEIANTNTLLKRLIEEIKTTNEIAKQNASATRELATELNHIKMMFARYGVASTGQSIL